MAEEEARDREERRRERDFHDNQGPPPVAKSRFAAAAAMAEEESFEREERRRERDAFYNRGDDHRGGGGEGGAPMPQQSRFAAAAAADEDYVSFEDRERRMAERRFEERDGGGRFGGRDDYGRRGDDRGFRGNDRGGYDEQYEDDREFESRQSKSRVDDLLKPKAPPAVDNVLKPPTKPAPEHEAFMLKVPAKAVEKEENVLVPPKKKVDEPKTEEKVQEPTPEPAAAAPDVNKEELLDEFSSGNKLGDELKAWVEENRVSLPSIDKLVFHMLTEREKLNPDLECGWAEPSKYGSALLALVGDDLYAQMQVLWGIQLYCDKLGFPKLNEEYVVQAMFRSMYKYDLATDEAFLEWKEDESDEHETGKMKAIIQTVDWFNWLEEDDEEEEDEYEEE